MDSVRMKQPTVYLCSTSYIHGYFRELYDKGCLWLGGDKWWPDL